MAGTLQVYVSKIGLRVYPEVYIVAIDTFGNAFFGDLIPYEEDRFYQLGTGLWTIKAVNDVSGEIQEKDIEILESQITNVEFTFGVAPTVAQPLIDIAFILGSITVGLMVIQIVLGSK